MRWLPTLLFASLGFLTGLAMQSPLHGVVFYDWRGPFAALAMAGFGAGTGAGLQEDGDAAFRRGIRGSVIGGAVGGALGLVGAGFTLTALAALILALSLGARQPEHTA